MHQCRSTGLLYAWGPRPKHYLSVSGVRLGETGDDKEDDDVGRKHGRGRVTQAGVAHV